MMKPERRYLCVFVCLIALVLASYPGGAWAMPSAAPLRQTVPMTPPPTWTPQASWMPSPQPTVVSVPTLSVPGTASQLWVSMAADKMIIEPGDQIELTIDVANVGGQDAHAARLSVDVAGLKIVSASDDLLPDAKDCWVLGELEMGQTCAFQVVLQVPEELWPGTTYTLVAIVTDDESMDSYTTQLVAPRAILPATGL